MEQENIGALAAKGTARSRQRAHAGRVAPLGTSCVCVCVRVSVNVDVECQHGPRTCVVSKDRHLQSPPVPWLHGPCTSETCPPGRALQACRSAPGLGEQASVLTARVGEQSVPWALTQASEAHARRLPLKRALCPELDPETL